MKVNAFKVAAGLAGSLILSAAASADFTGIALENKSPSGPIGGRTYFVCNVYACFTSTADRLLSITQAQISTTGGASLFQHPFGTSTAPNSAFFPLPGFETLPFDSFVTIGLKSIPVGGTDSTSLEPGAAFTGAGGTGGFTGGWFNSNPDNNQGAPVAVPGLPTPGFYVLIAQLTFQNPGPTWGTTGNMLVAWKAAGGATAIFTPGSFSHGVPAPGALALLGLAGLASRRRRA